MIGAVFVFRSAYGTTTENYLQEWAYTLFFVFGSVTIVKDIPLIRNIFIYLGEKSMGLWLIHSVVLIHSNVIWGLPILKEVPKYSIVLFLIYLVISLFITISLDKFWNILGKFYFNTKNR